MEHNDEVTVLAGTVVDPVIDYTREGCRAVKLEDGAVAFPEDHLAEGDKVVVIIVKLENEDVKTAVAPDWGSHSV